MSEERNLYAQEWPPQSPADLNRRECTLMAAKMMLNAALTAPFGGGVPQIEACIVHDIRELEKVARKMEEVAYEQKRERLERMFKYEAVMVRESDAILFLGNFRAATMPMNSGCGMCGGRPNCSYVYEKRPHSGGLIERKTIHPDWLVDGPLCSVHVEDLGYAVGSALWMATRMFVDCRPFMTVGVAGQRLGLCPNSAIVVGLPVATLSKNPYVDIHPDYHLLNMNTVVQGARKAYIIPRQMGTNYRIWDPAIGRKKKEEGEEET
jgi:uncharacterized ferredoxin-like protein